MASVSQNKRTRKIIFFHVFGFFSWVYPGNFFIFHGVFVSKVFLATNYPNFNLCSGYEPPRWIIPFQKNSNSKYQGILKSPWDSVTRQLLLFQKVESNGGPFFKVILECKKGVLNLFLSIHLAYNVISCRKVEKTQMKIAKFSI